MKKGIVIAAAVLAVVGAAVVVVIRHGRSCYSACYFGK